MSDPTTHTDGLAGLQARRTAAKKAPTKRVIPPSQNPTTLPPYKSPDVAVAPEPSASVPAVPPVSQTPPVDKAPTVKAASHKVGLYIDEGHSDFFEAVRAAGHSHKPRVSLTSSAVVRLAMDRLIADLGVDGVRDALLAKPVDPTAVGRRRR